jgi:hypothetical protein
MNVIGFTVNRNGRAFAFERYDEKGGEGDWSVSTITVESCSAKYVREEFTKVVRRWRRGNRRTT